MNKEQRKRMDEVHAIVQGKTQMLPTKEHLMVVYQVLAGLIFSAEQIAEAGREEFGNG